MLYRYETHLHTSPVSKCARATVRESLDFYRILGYAGVFITNHFIDGNMQQSADMSYEERIRAHFSDYEDGVLIGREMGITVLGGVEMSYKGTDFLVYGLDKEWFLEHPEIEYMKKSEELPYLIEHGALVIQAHPYREASYIDHIRLFPRAVQGVEVINASCRDPIVNEMARLYADRYGLIPFAGSDNHSGPAVKRLAGMETDTPILDERDFIERVKRGEMRCFTMKNPILPG